MSLRPGSMSRPASPPSPPSSICSVSTEAAAVAFVMPHPPNPVTTHRWPAPLRRPAFGNESPGHRSCVDQRYVAGPTPKRSRAQAESPSYGSASGPTPTSCFAPTTTRYRCPPISAGRTGPPPPRPPPGGAWAACPADIGGSHRPSSVGLRDVHIRRTLAVRQLGRDRILLQRFHARHQQPLIRDRRARRDDHVACLDLDVVHLDTT